MRVGNEVPEDHGASEGQQRDRSDGGQSVAPGGVALESRRRGAVQQHGHEHSRGDGPDGGPGRGAEGGRRARARA